MAVRKIPVHVAADQFDRLARPTRPVAAIEELIWNGLDAEADTVEVTLGLTELGAVETVEVADDGHGMSYEDALRDFSALGGSWKQGKSRTRNDLRSLHGKSGVGRFRAFALGREVTWTSYAAGNGMGFQKIIVTGRVDNQEFEISDSETDLERGSSGTLVHTRGPRDLVRRLLADDTLPALVAKFAIFLTKYPHVKIIYNRNELDVASIIGCRSSLNVSHGLGEPHGDLLVELVEWTTNIDRSIILCDDQGVALHEVTDDLPRARDICYTVYVQWPGFLEYANDLVLADMDHEILQPILSATRDAIGAYLEERRLATQASIIREWREQDVYPFSDDPKDELQVAERRLFDAVALTAEPSLRGNSEATRLSLRLIREALENDPGSLHDVLRDVLDLSPEQVEDFAILLRKASLPAIIATTKAITDRLEFLDDLESLLFDATAKARLLERSQLHKILEVHTWVFGENMALTVSNRGLTEVLKKHQELIGQGTIIDGPVRDLEGNTRIVDLMMSRAVHREQGRHHLVVELKRPSTRLSLTETSQVLRYASAIAADERFSTQNVQWDFWLIGNEMDEVVRAQSHQRGQPPGSLSAPEGENYRVWVKEWSDLLEENRSRHHFYRDNLEYSSESDGSFEATLGKYLPQGE